MMKIKENRRIWACVLLAMLLVGAAAAQDDSTEPKQITTDQLQRLAARMDGNPLIDKTDVRVEMDEPSEAHQKRSASLRRYARLAYLMQDKQFDEAGEILKAIEQAREEWPMALRVLEVRYFLESNQADVAFERATALIAEHPEAIEAYLLMGDIEHVRQNHDAVIEWLEKARAIAPRNQQVLQSLGRRYEFSMQTAKTTEDFSKALTNMEEVYGDLVKTLPGRRGARYLRLLAYISEKNNHPDKALEYMRQLVRVQADEMDFVLKLAALEVAQGNLDEARQVLRQALIREPENELLRKAILDYFRTPGVLAPEEDRAEAILEFYRSVAKEYPGRDNLQIELARMLIGASKEEEAMSILQDSLDFRPTNQQTRLLLAELHGSLKNEEQTVVLLEEYMRRADNDSLSMRTAVAMMLRHGFNSQAEKLLKDIIEREPELWRIRLMLADLYGRTNQDESIEPLLKKTAEDFGKDPEALFHIAMRAWDSGQKDYAEQLLKNVITLAPDHAEAHNSLGYFMTERNKDLDEALRLINRAMQLNPNQGHIIDSLGWVYYKKGLYEKAIQTLEDANKLLQPEAETIEHLAWAYLAVGRDRDALAHFKVAIELLELQQANPETIEKIERLQNEVDKIEAKNTGVIPDGAQAQ